MRSGAPWIPALILCAGLAGARLLAVQPERRLQQSLSSAIPRDLLGYVGTDTILGDDVLSAARTTSHLARIYRPGPDAGTDAGFELHVCFYSRQGPEKWEASPGLCHKDGQWAVVQTDGHSVPVRGSAVAVRRYSLARDRESRSAIALVWHQGRGRIASNPFAVRWNRIRDGILRRRGDEAVVRVLVPGAGARPTRADLRLADRIAAEVIPRLDRALPGTEP